MSNWAISIENVSKMYKYFPNSKDRIADLLGLKFLSRNKFEEFWALRNINLQIEKGSKVALVGRNGAGKSTLLKMIAGTLKPTEGKIRVNGKVSALMELGTGFHPEFTGKENIFASLSYMGIVGQEAKRLYEDIVEFSELEDFIHKPIKTYSAGMYARLAFSTSTAIVPEILIIDEILGAGDSYFINKSMDRMRKLTDEGTTVLFVSHDISSVQKLCTEAIWIDRGSVVSRGDILDVTAEYLASIRMQEELRLKAKNVRIKQSNIKLLEETLHGDLVYVHFVTDQGSPREEHPISAARLFTDHQKIDELNIGSGMDSNTQDLMFLMVDSDTINWSSPKREGEKTYRSFIDVGGKFQHALLAFKTATLESMNYELEIDYKDVSSEPVYVEFFNGESYQRLGRFESVCDGNWKTARFRIYTEAKAEEIQTHANIENIRMEREMNDRIYGSGEMLITKVRFVDETRSEKFIFTTGGYLKVVIDYYAEERIMNPIFVVAVYMMDGTCATQVMSNLDGLAPRSYQGEGSVEVIFNPLLLGKGNYRVSVAIFKELNMLDNVEPEAYDIHDRLYEIKIEQPFGINVDLGVVNHPVRWGG